MHAEKAIAQLLAAIVSVLEGQAIVEARRIEICLKVTYVNDLAAHFELKERRTSAITRRDQKFLQVSAQEICVLTRIGKVEDIIGVVHARDVFIKITPGTHRADLFCIVAIEDADETRIQPFNVILVNDVCKSQPVLWANRTRIIGNLDDQRASVQQCWIGWRQAG